MMTCNNCGWHFEDDTALRILERCGECHGIPSGQFMYYCPRCNHGDVSQAERCSVCGKWKPADDLNSSGICPDCMAEPEESLYLILKKYGQAKDELKKFEKRCLMLERNAISLARRGCEEF